MRSDGENNDLALLNAVVPEDPVSRWCFTLCIGCKDFLTLRPLQAFILVGSEAGMVKICFHEAEGLSDSLEAFFKALVSLELFSLLLRRRCEFKPESRQT